MGALAAGSALRWLWLGAVVVVVTFPVYVTVVTALLPSGDVAAGRLVPVPDRLTFHDHSPQQSMPYGRETGRSAHLSLPAHQALWFTEPGPEP
ncbi:hypothetical protein [Streptomyces sp. DSM 40750]|uniref:hypothetical protein n=1 Tax=Streptomyces sp. DSM 40750 TaxID=2801030 RepID=UPI00214B6680|nr:hypothetical protein [Streptomyces sp. DSM 40750]UUU19191.1 hypothetical protein JIX55_01985 [Streptomyces sp. DSM 40750]UUU27465.1 hypothetical protein JIX55_48760 [Streptomyces sp. DSM 40750]